MAQQTTRSTLDGNFKEVYSPKIEIIIPNFAILQRDIGLSKSDLKLGNQYHQPVKLTHSHGITRAAPNSGAFNLRTSVAPEYRDAQIDSYQYVQTDEIDYESAFRSLKGREAYRSANDLIVESMIDSLRKNIEIDMLYGDSPNSQLGLVPTSTNQTSTSTRLEYAASNWSDAVWTGMENQILEFYHDDELVSSGSDSKFTVVSVDYENRYVNVSGTSTGITALDAAIAGSGEVGTYIEGSFNNMMAGLDRITTNEGLLFNISAQDFSIWKSNLVSASNGELTMKKILKGISRAQGKGLMSYVCLYVNPKTWNCLNSDQAALREYDSSYKVKSENGFGAIEFHSQTGGIEVKSHPFVREGDGFMIPKMKFKRIGSVDISFERPGRPGEFYDELSGQAGYQLRAYSNQSLFTHCPAQSTKFTDIINTNG